MKSKILIFTYIFTAFISVYSYGQKVETYFVIDKTAIQVDSLIQEIYRDTIKFNEKDLVFTQIGRRNINSYSMLYVVNGSYFYMLDIISSDNVVEFVNEILDTDKIASIDIVSKEKLSAFYGVRAQNGIVLVVLKKNVKLNPLVAGFNFTGSSGGDNFSKRNDNELMIRE